uniref:FYVE and coiled-coil domain-containing protein 1 n=1 Tax=Salarias fasciatus TaxID=181472 RepID=A0A672I4S2_SALFA
MAAGGATVGESQLQRIIRDLHEAVSELAKEYRESGEPITDDSTNLHKFSYKLEYLLQFDQKEKTTFLGTKKDYWDYFNDCIAKIKGANDGIRFVKSITELKTSLGKGRAFIRYSLVHQRLADTLQQCLMNQRVTSDWYYARSPFLKPHLSVDIISHLYELNEVQFDVASRGHDLDASWPTFARRTLGSANSPAHLWKPPSRTSSINSLASSYSQNLLNDLNESLPACMEDVSAVEDLRLELDQSELKQRELLGKVQQLGEEAAELRRVVVELQGQLDVSLAAQEAQQGLHGELKALRWREETLSRELETLRQEEKSREAQQVSLQQKLTTAEERNIELMAKMDSVLNEKGHQAASYFDSAQKIHDLLDRLKEAEKGKMEAVAEVDEKRKQSERLEDELRVKEAAAKDGESKLGALVTSLSEEKAKLEAEIEEQRNAYDKLQGTLTLREKETSNLQRQLQDLQRSFEEKDKEVEEAKQREKEDKEKMEKKVGVLKKSLEEEVTALTEQLMQKESELISSCKALKDLEAKNQSLTTEKDKLNTSLSELDGSIKEQAMKIEDYKMQCTNLMDLNEKLLSTVKRNEELKKEMAENRTWLEAELAALRASEKQLRGQLDDTKMTVDEKEKRLREENCKLDESLQRATMAAELSETTAKRLEQENQSLREEQDTVKAALSRMQADLKNVHGQIGELEKNLGASRKNEASLQEELQAKVHQLESKEEDFVELQSKIKALEAKEKELEAAKADLETTCAKQTEMIELVTSEKNSIKKTQLERSTVQAKESQEVSRKLTVAEGQLEVTMNEVSKLQAEVLDLRVHLARSDEVKVKAQAQLEVTEAQRDELRTLTEQLQSQLEALNKKHVNELMECKKKEEAITNQRDREVAAHAELSISAAALREELSTLKAENDRLVLENNETRDGLHRANTEMAELGMTICKLNAEKEASTEHWGANAAKTEELMKEVQQLKETMEELQVENGKLKEELIQKNTLPGTVKELQKQLEKTKNQVKTIKDSSREEIEGLKFQMSSESMNSEVLVKVSQNLQTYVFSLFFDNEIQQLRDTLTKAEEERSEAQKLCENLEQKLNMTEADQKTQLIKMTAEIDDLNRTKTNLEERLIELIKDKDALWQKSDALEFEQKLRAEERWWLVDKEATNCLDCQSQFTWLLRRHHCRLCGRIFCYYCSNNFVMTKQSGKKERCCKDCYTQHSAVEERFTDAELSPSDFVESVSYLPVSDPSPRSDDGAFDIITEEEVNGCDGSVFFCCVSLKVIIILFYAVTFMPHNSSHSCCIGFFRGVGDVTPDEEQVPTVQDSEIHLLKSGEITMDVPLSLDDISQFVDGSKELFIKSSCYSTISVVVGDSGPSISWIFSSEPKSISFSVVYRELMDTPVEQSKVLIPLTRCNSHKEKIQGQLKVRHPGLYTLIFDNSFSRFISKKVSYHLTMEKPVIYDGSDCP